MKKSTFLLFLTYFSVSKVIWESTQEIDEALTLILTSFETRNHRKAIESVLEDPRLIHFYANELVYNHNKYEFHFQHCFKDPQFLDTKPEFLRQKFNLEIILKDSPKYHLCLKTHKAYQKMANKKYINFAKFEKITLEKYFAFFITEKYGVEMCVRIVQQFTSMQELITNPQILNPPLCFISVDNFYLNIILRLLHTMTVIHDQFNIFHTALNAQNLKIISLTNFTLESEGLNCENINIFISGYENFWDVTDQHKKSADFLYNSPFVPPEIIAKCGLILNKNDAHQQICLNNYEFDSEKKEEAYILGKIIENWIFLKGDQQKLWEQNNRFIEVRKLIIKLTDENINERPSIKKVYCDIDTLLTGPTFKETKKFMSIGYIDCSIIKNTKTR